MLKGKVAIVTGSTSGIGLGIARALAAEGADVLINGFGDAALIEKLLACHRLTSTASSRLPVGRIRQTGPHRYIFIHHGAP
jgi:NAD(P)-dependent dehydrogenase (short-subunit alcohol dehydrogenase family)